MKRPAISRAIAFVEGVADQDDMAWLRAGFALAFRDGVPLEVALSLPATAARRRTALRDFWLEQAAAQCDETLPWRRACELARVGREFEQRTWPRWRKREAPPPEASAIEQALFYLHRHDGRVPSARRLHDLLCATAIVDQDIAVRPVQECSA
jgi:hypothetical protein